ncbi:MAG: ABC transporter permease subunit [Nitrospirota bacterium]
MRTVLEVARITFKGGIRDKIFITLLVVSILCFIILVPAISSLSMRQVREVSVSMSLSIISFISLVLTVFLGVNLVYRDIERRFSHSVISMPISREAYILGKFLGLSAIIGAAVIILSFFSSIGIIITSTFYKSTIPMLWENFLAAIFFETFILVIVAAISIFFSSFSSNIFLPLFATIGFYVIGNVTQAVMDYIQGTSGKNLPAMSVYISKIAYYIFPNLTALDFKFNAIYGLSISPVYIVMIFLYAIFYTAIVIGISLLIFRKRELL